MYRRLLITCTFIFILSLHGTTKSFSGPQQFSDGQPGISQGFYELLREINDNSSAVQHSKLEAFVKKNPGFAPGAMWLFDKYVIAGNLLRAERFFTNLPDSGPSLLTKNWMLGKAHSQQGESNLALKAFTSALTAASPSPELIRDFFIFDIGNHRKFEDRDYVTELALDDEALSAMNALWHYINREWQPAIEEFNTLSSQFNNNLTIMYSWGYCLNRTGQDQLAKEKWQRGLEIARTGGDQQFESDFLLHLGIIAQTLEATLSYYDSAYAIAKQIGALTQLEYLAGNRGTLYSRQGRFSLADSLYREAIDAGRQMQSAWRMCVWYPRLGDLLVQQARFDEALQAYDEGADLARKAGNTEKLIRCQIGGGRLYRLLGQYELARRVLTRAYKEALDRGEPLLEVQARTELASLDLHTGRYAEARQVYNTHLKIPPTTYNELQDHATYGIDAGRTYIAQHNYDAARSEFVEAFFWADSAKANFDTALSLLHLAEIDLIGNDPVRAHERLDECLIFAGATELDQVLSAIYSVRGDAYQKEGELEKALHQYKKAANLIEQIRKNLSSEASKLDYFRDKSDIYDKLVECYRDFYATTGNAVYQDSLYIYMEMKRGRTLRELRAGNGAETGDSDSDFRRANLLQARKRLRSQQRYLRDYEALFTKQEMDSILVQIQAARLSLIAQRLRLTQDASVRSEDVQAQLPSLQKLRSTLEANQSAAIFYHLSEHPFALVITGEGSTFVPLPTTITRLDSAIQALLNPFHGVTTDASETVFRADLAHELYRTLVAPVEEAVQLPANLVIAPDAHLANLPFELLLTAKPERSEYTPTDPATYSDDFLIQRHSIAYVPNASFLVDVDFGAAAKDVLVFADPFDEAPLTDGQLVASLRTGLRFDPLIYSSREASGIKEVHAKTTIFRRGKATKATLFREAPKYYIVHFATHAFVDTTYDAFSGLVLSTSDDREDDGILMGYEIADLNLQADLVTLSACETGRGKVVAGEGVLGLPRLFLGAGANTVLMTHWKVDDKFSADLMVDFYDYYLKQGLPKARALAEAKRNVLNRPRKSGGINYRHPFYWASFAMYGEPGFRKSRLSTEFVIAAALILLISLLLVGLKNTMKKTASMAHKKVSDKS